MNDKQFLQWIYDRLKHEHGEDYRVDYMGKLRSIIAATPEDRVTPNSISFDKEDMVKRLDGPWVEISQGLSREEMRGFMCGKADDAPQIINGDRIKDIQETYTPCKHYDCGWCYHVEGGNSDQGQCLEPLECFYREVL